MTEHPLAGYAQLVQFARWVITSSTFSGLYLDGGDVQAKALELGLLHQEAFDPDKHEVFEEYEGEPGDPILFFSGPLA